MPHKVTSWLKVAAGFQFLTAAFHSISLIVSPQGQNESEKQLLDLMHSYKMDMGAGIHRSMWQLYSAMSACFVLLFLLGALVNLYIVRNKTSPEWIRGILAMEMIVFGICFLVMTFLTFIPPAALTGLVFAFLIASYFRTR
ncbi:MAG TPA: hypothetical protein VL728_00345 [Cyclobacteriaceae bacterium]|nr:hypothetical protein [Cyclobacteriaceae bacterium]